MERQKCEYTSQSIHGRPEYPNFFSKLRETTATIQQGEQQEKCLIGNAHYCTDSLKQHNQTQSYDPLPNTSQYNLLPTDRERC